MELGANHLRGALGEHNLVPIRRMPTEKPGNQGREGGYLPPGEEVGQVPTGTALEGSALPE